MPGRQQRKSWRPTNSPCVDAGTATPLNGKTAPEYDAWAAQRSIIPDIGAFEAPLPALSTVIMFR